MAKHTLMSNSKIKVIIFGTGEYYKRYNKWLELADIVALLDNDSSVQGTFIDGVKVYSPGEVSTFDYDYIYILSLREKEMRSQLLRLGVKSEKIKSWKNFIIDYQYYANKKIKKYFSNKVHCKEEKSDVLFITDNLERTGGNIAGMYMAQAIYDSGYNVTIASYKDGPLRKYDIFDKFEFIIDPNLQVETLADIENINKYKAIVLNTIYLYLMLLRRPTDIPVLWWLHEPRDIYYFISEKEIELIENKNLYIYAVSDFAREAFYSVSKKFKIGILPLGEPDFTRLYRFKQSRRRKRITFGVAGVISQIKGQEILLGAIRKLSTKDLNKSEFWFAGNAESSFGKKIIDEISSLNENIRYLGELGEEEMPKFYNDIDVLIVPSITETLSMTSIEAMMFKKMSIVSSGAGISSFIENLYNGIIFQNKNEEELTKTISYCLNNIDEVKSIGYNARKLYEEMFEFEHFKGSIKEILFRLLSRNVENEDD